MNSTTQHSAPVFKNTLSTFTKDTGFCVFLNPTEDNGRHYYVFHQPVKQFSAWLNNGNLVDAESKATNIQQLRQQAENHAKAIDGCIAGYVGYESLLNHANIHPNGEARCGVPAVQFFVYDNYHQTKAPLEIVSSSAKPFATEHAFQASETQQTYLKAIDHIKRYILAGDCYQINYSQHFSTQYSGDFWLAFLSLIEKFSAPYGGYIHTGHGEIASISPEQFVHVKNNSHIITRPIKGSAARHSDPEIDQQNATALQNSAKNRAENLMIVDLLRNDLGKICETGSVKTDKLFALETFTNVHHLISTVSGQLRSDITPLEALIACFPGGSITGAPKQRAMEIINELENVQRSVYCGSMFFQLPNGELNSNIMIRTLAAENGWVHCWGGGGIVADSNPEEEYRESLFKVEAFMRHLESL